MGAFLVAADLWEADLELIVLGVADLELIVLGVVVLEPSDLLVVGLLVADPLTAGPVAVAGVVLVAAGHWGCVQVAAVVVAT